MRLLRRVRLAGREGRLIIIVYHFFVVVKVSCLLEINIDCDVF